MQQPMLVSKLKKKVQEKNQPDICYLVPELCTMTGLTAEMRANFTLMKDLSVHTRLDPNRRLTAMQQFREQIQQNETAHSRLANWGMQFAPRPVELTGRVLPPDEVMLGPNGRDSRHTVSNALYYILVTLCTIFLCEFCMKKLFQNLKLDRLSGTIAIRFSRFH